MTMHARLKPPPQFKEKQDVAALALRFVYPDLQFSNDQVTAELAVLAIFLARALDGTSRITYGCYQFYSGVTTGVLKGVITWRDIPEIVIDSVKAALEDEKPQRNLIASSFILMKFPPRLISAHLSDPETFPCPEIRVNKDNLLDRWVFKL